MDWSQNRLNDLLNMDGLLAQQSRLQSQAHEVLESLHLIGLLSRYGQPRIVGSVALGLMTWRDIDVDLEITGEIVDDHFWQVARHVLAQDGVTLVSLVDNRKGFEYECPPSMYIGVKWRSDDGAEWKMDIRFVSEQHAIAHDYVESIRSRLTDGKRSAILGIKQVIAQDPRYGREISSVKIYAAVLDAGVTDLDGFRDHLRRSGIEL